MGRGWGCRGDLSLVPHLAWPLLAPRRDEGGIRLAELVVEENMPLFPVTLPKAMRPCPQCGGPTYDASRPGSTIQYDHCYKCEVTWSNEK